MRRVGTQTCPVMRRPYNERRLKIITQLDRMGRNASTLSIFSGLCMFTEGLPI